MQYIFHLGYEYNFIFWKNYEKNLAKVTQHNGTIQY